MSGVNATWARALTALAGLERDRRSLAGRLLAAPSDAPALLSASGTLTYADLATRIRRHANRALLEGLRPGDVVGLLAANSPDYAAAWLGVSRVGGVVALLNTALHGEALAHAVATGGCRWVIADRAIGGVPTWPLDPGADDTPLATADPAPHETALLIYTSGTTGYPKAVRITHGRIMEWSAWFAAMMALTPQDRIYNCLPMYHSIGGVVAVGAPLLAGASVFVRPGFSASCFWDEVIEHRCTVFQYIGELCRYLVASPPHPRAHSLRLACGNGLQAEVWRRFAERFHVKQVLEYYAATEGSVSLYNVEGVPGAIGRIPPFLAHRFPVALIRVDEDGLALRDAAGRCVRAAIDEPGEAIGPVPHQGLYTDAAASTSKILRDVFASGDAWFRTGDLMRRDAAGFFYFVDRLGDTFRWKGENVSTAEVADVLGRCPGVTAITVYGVAMPGQEGRAGMAAIEAGPGFDPALLARHAAALPPYARPLFIRLTTLSTTGTFKPVKAALVREGYDAAAVTDELFTLGPDQASYVPLHPRSRTGASQSQSRSP